MRYIRLTALFAIAHPVVAALLTNLGYKVNDTWFCCPSVFWFFLSGLLYWGWLLKRNGADELF